MRRHFEAAFDIFVFADDLNAFDAMLANPPAAVISDDRTLSTTGNHIHKLKCEHDVLKHIPFFITSDEFQGSYVGGDGTGVADHFFIRPVDLGFLYKHILHSTQNTVPNIRKAKLHKTIDHFDALARSVANHTKLDKRLLKTTWNPLVDCIKNEEYMLALKTLKSYGNTFYSHSVRVAIFMCVFAKIFKVSQRETVILASGGYMLDLGIMLLPKSLLNKAEVFSRANQIMMQEHVNYTQEILETIEGTDPLVFEITKLHHERLDGSGYPRGLQGSQINELGRMAAIADVFAALTDRRPHRPPIDTTSAFKKMRGMDKALDQDLLRLFQNVMDHKPRR